MAPPRVMIIEFARTFSKQLRKFSVQERDRVNQAIEIFKRNPFAVLLRNHKLQGVQKGIRSISAGYDIRILYVEKDDHAFVLFIHIGSHEDIYE